MRSITAVSTICPNLHINCWLHWMFTYFPVMRTPVYVQNRIALCLCFRRDLKYPPQVLFFSQYCLVVCIAGGMAPGKPEYQNSYRGEIGGQLGGICAIQIMESILGSTTLVVNRCDNISALIKASIQPEAVT